MSEASLLEVALRRDRSIVIGGIFIVIVISWIYILMGAGMGMTAFEMSSLAMSSSEESSAMAMQNTEIDMASSTGMGEAMRSAHATMAQLTTWTPGYALIMFFMWWVMMVAMMVPSASPMLLLFAAVNRKQRTQGSPFVSTSVFGAGYIVAWGGFSLLAVGVQWGLERAGVLSAMMSSTNVLLTGLVLLAAGVYQFTPLKNACLRHCRTPMDFVAHHWRTGSFGAFRMGIEHGVFCLGCCWTLMALLFVGGVMNLYWIAAIAVFVLLEKTIPTGHKLGALTGIGLILWGGWTVAGALLL